jgi:hypothetical protein
MTAKKSETIKFTGKTASRCLNTAPTRFDTGLQTMSASTNPTFSHEQVAILLSGAVHALKAATDGSSPFLLNIHLLTTFLAYIQSPDRNPDASGHILSAIASLSLATTVPETPAREGALLGFFSSIR